MSDGELESEIFLTARELKEIERRRQKYKKKRESKKANRKTRSDSDSAVPSDEFEEQSGAVTDTAASADEPPAEGTTMEEDVKVDLAATQVGAAKGKVSGKSEQLTASVEIEYVGETPKLDESDPNFHYFSKIFEAFKVKSEEELAREGVVKLPKPEIIVEDTSNKAAISEQILQEEMRQRRKSPAKSMIKSTRKRKAPHSKEAEESGEAQKMSRKKLRLAMQPSIADLKATTTHPEVVEWADVTSRDPFLLVELKSYRNTVPVPRHWNAKRKYLAGKRGFERPPFELPDFIKRTGIQEMRESMWEKEDAQGMKSKMRERVRPKLGRIDIDYQKLHDAFFKWQTKPAMTKMGELYYEGKEMEAQMKEKKPGMLSDELRIALGMPVGPNCTKFPPPWLIAMQRYGPPPSYPNLRIPGLNAPIPEGCAFGYHAGGWGKPPVDEYGKPLYGDVFGVELGGVNDIEDESKIDRRHWGEIASDEEESDDESEPEEGLGEEGDADAAAAPPESGFVTPATEGFTTPSGFTSVPGGLETPASIELRKEKGASDASLAGADTPRELYSVLPEKRVDRIAGQYMGSSHVYDVTGQRKMPAPSDGVEVSLNPEELDFTDPKGLERKYEEQLRKQNRLRADNEEDFSDLVAEHSAKQNRKRKAHQDQKSSSSDKKKYKDFKF